MSSIYDKSTRRSFLAGIAAAGLESGLLSASSLPEDASESAALGDARRKAVRRRRRIIFNNDGDDIWAKGADTTGKFLAARHTPLLGTQVDSIYYCTTQSFNRFTHDTQVAEIFRSRSGSFAGNNLDSFLKQDTDGLRMSTEFARDHGLETIWTLRMNDIHDAWTPAFFSDWKKADPSRIMSTLEESKKHNDRRRLWSLVDFEHPDVEPRLIEIIQEVLPGHPVGVLTGPNLAREIMAGQAAASVIAMAIAGLVLAVSVQDRDVPTAVVVRGSVERALDGALAASAARAGDYAL